MLKGRVQEDHYEFVFYKPAKHQGKICQRVERTTRWIQSELQYAARAAPLGQEMHGKPTIFAQHLENVGVHPCL